MVELQLRFGMPGGGLPRRPGLAQYMLSPTVSQGSSKQPLQPTYYTPSQHRRHRCSPLETSQGGPAASAQGSSYPYHPFNGA